MLGLMDCNNFFVSCERLFRPDLHKKPVAVLSSNDGCVIARSQEVKDIGISMGAPYFEIKDICEKQKVTLFSSNFKLYRDISRRVMASLKEEFNTCEVYSVDEAFFKIDNPHVEEFVTIRDTIIQKTGIPVSIGIASTKTLAKVASSIAKKGSGTCILDAVKWDEIKKNTPCGSIWGIGRQTALFLSQHKIYTVSELLLNEAFVKSELGVLGERLVHEIKGTPVYEVTNTIHESQDSYTSTRSFGKKIKDRQVLMSALSYHATQVAKKMRDDAVLGLQINVILRGGRDVPIEKQERIAYKELETPSNNTLVFIQKIDEIFREIYDPTIAYKKCGVVVSRIVPEIYTTDSLFSQNNTKKAHDTDSIIDTLNMQFGKTQIHRAITLGVDKWEAKKNLISKEYTTKWNDIATVTTDI